MDGLIQRIVLNFRIRGVVQLVVESIALDQANQTLFAAQVVYLEKPLSVPSPPRWSI